MLVAETTKIPEKGSVLTLTPLLPDRHPQRNFFIADVFDNLPVKDDIASMESPFFTLSTKPDLRQLSYKSGNKSVGVIPSSLGLPTIFDKDVLLYCASQVIEQLNKGETPPKTLHISIHDFLIATNRNTSGDAYRRFESCLYRLRGCTVTTTIKTGRTSQIEGFGLIESFAYLKSNHVKDRFIGLEITLSDWFYNSLIAKEVLTIDRDYFRLRKPIERRVYEIARKHCGNQKSWDITLKKLYEKSGALSAIKHFRASVKALSEHNHLPEYELSFDRKTDKVTFTNRKKTSLEITDATPDLFDTSKEAIPHHIPPALLEKVRKHVGVGLDYYTVWAAFRKYNQGKQLDSIDGAFIGFCRSKAVELMRHE